MKNMNLREVPVKNVEIRDSFWSDYQKLIIEDVIPYQEKILDDQIPDIEKSHALANFRIAAGMESGEYYGMVFQDSDVAKWLEGVAYSLAVQPDSELEKRADDIIEIVARAQQEDGYLNTYFTVKRPENRWENLHEAHELYCAGHMMEAAVAYYEATGKSRLLEVMERMADHIDRRFGEGRQAGIPGHQEIEIGLMRLFRCTGKEKYRDLAAYFLNTRGHDPEFFKKEKMKRSWNLYGEEGLDPEYEQSHLPVREQKDAVGHSVRAVYMYTAMADLAGQTNDERLYQACETLWDSMAKKRMYITGGIGSTVQGEAFTTDYDLPNDSIYAETCASIALMFFGKKMLDINPNRKYSDIMERALYNGIISGMQLDGKRFFYVNPLEVNPGISGVYEGFRHVLPERPEWYACACCPPNVVRLLTSLGQYAWSEGEDAVYSHLYIGGQAVLNKAVIDVESTYPWSGAVRYKVSPKTDREFAVAIRIPGWSKNTVVTLNGGSVSLDELDESGYLYVNRVWRDGDEITVMLDMSVRKYYANTQVRADAGCVAYARGPFVYCAEGKDHEVPLQTLRVKTETAINEVSTRLMSFKSASLCVDEAVGLELEGYTLERTDELYTQKRPEKIKTTLKLIPYYMWGNRGLNQMRVWIGEMD